MSVKKPTNEKTHRRAGSEGSLCSQCDLDQTTPVGQTGSLDKDNYKDEDAGFHGEGSRIKMRKTISSDGMRGQKQEGVPSEQEVLQRPLTW